MNLYKRIRLRREELGLSQEELANMLGYRSRSTIAKIEIGENDITQSKIEAFAKALQTTPGYLMGLDDTLANEDKLPNTTPPNLNTKSETDITKMIDDLKVRLSTPELTFKGKIVTEEEKQALINGMQIALQIALQKK